MYGQLIYHRKILLSRICSFYSIIYKVIDIHNIVGNNLEKSIFGAHMKNNFGMIVAVTAALIFYLRLIIVQRQRAKSLSQNSQRRFPMLLIRYPIILSAGVIVVLAGAGLSAASGPLAQYASYWWIPVTIGILLTSYSII